MPKILNGQNMGTKLLILIDLVKMIFLLMHILELFFFLKLIITVNPQKILIYTLEIFKKILSNVDIYTNMTD